MYKIFLNKLIMMFVTVAVIGGVSTTTLPMLNNEHTTIGKSQTSNTKENNIKDLTGDSKETPKNDADKESDSAPISKETNDSSQNNQDTNKQQTVNTKSEKPITNTSRQTTTSATSKNQNNTTATVEVKTPTISYDRTTSIYANDNVTLLRVEYYKNNKLTYYSVVEQFDVATKSYIEKIYQCNRVTNIDPLIRTDVYANGSLIKSY